MAAAYECNASCTDDESFVLTFVLTTSDGSPFDVSDYAFEYSLRGCSPEWSLDEADGIVVDAPNATLTITPGLDVRLRKGTYRHGLRKRHLVTDQVDQIFDGTVTVTEGNFQ